MLGLGTIAKKVFGTTNDRKVRATQPIVDSINALEEEFSALSDEAPFEQASVHKTVALARLVSAMKEAAEIYRTDQDGAVAVQQRAHTQFEDALMDLDDDALEPERELSAALLSLMRTGASQESFYGGF